MVAGVSTRGTARVPKNPEDEGVSANCYKVHPHSVAHSSTTQKQLPISSAFLLE